jgi:carbon-monoxide dehydrogenase large subunit
LLSADELRRPNVVGNDLAETSFRDALAAALEMVNYDAVRKMQREAPTRRIGIGIALYAENTGIGSRGWRSRGVIGVPGYDAARVRVLLDGSVEVATSVPEVGQGHESAVAQIVADELAVSLDCVHVRPINTAETPYGTGAFASRGAIAGGGAALGAAKLMAEKLRRVAALLLECSAADIVLASDGLHPAGLPSRRLGLAEVARAAYYPDAALTAAGIDPGLETIHLYDPPPITFANGCHVAVVEVDRATAQVRIVRYVVVHDCGRVINPVSVAAQVQGGVAQGVASAFSEMLVYDDAGQLLTATLADYPVPRALDVPTVELGHVGTLSAATAGGYKGVGESGIIGAPAALINAVADALPDIGGRLCRVPLTAADLWTVLTTATAAAVADVEADARVS